MSHALRVRGLKRNANRNRPLKRLSHALRVRGLKQTLPAVPPSNPLVARSTRAWIETFPVRSPLEVPLMSHALRVRGLKQNGRAPPVMLRRVARSTRAWIETNIN